MNTEKLIKVQAGSEEKTHYEAGEIIKARVAALS